MFVYLNQLASQEPICLDVANIREFHPQVTQVEGTDRKGTLITLYRGEPWIVKQSCYDVLQICQRAKRGEL